MMQFAAKKINVGLPRFLWEAGENLGKSTKISLGSEI